MFFVLFIIIIFLCVTLWLCWIICTDLFFWVFNIFHFRSWVLLKRWQEVDKLNLFLCSSFSVLEKIHLFASVNSEGGIPE